MQQGNETSTDRPIRGWWLVLRAVLTIIVGPPLGTVAVLLVFVILSIPENLPSMGEFFAGMRQILPFGLVIGGIPAVLGAVAMALVSPWLHGWPIVLTVATGIGALAGLLGTVLYLTIVGGMSLGSEAMAGMFPFLLVAAAAGAFSLPACTFGFDALQRRFRGVA